jgi:putative N6-adenine-specific DNA methylase
MFFGFEEILENELRALGAQDVEKGVRMVSFKGDKGFMYKANFIVAYGT